MLLCHAHGLSAVSCDYRPGRCCCAQILVPRCGLVEALAMREWRRVLRLDQRPGLGQESFALGVAVWSVFSIDLDWNGDFWRVNRM